MKYATVTTVNKYTISINQNLYSAP